MKSKLKKVKAWAVLKNGKLEWNCGDCYPEISLHKKGWCDAVYETEQIVPCTIIYTIPHKPTGNKK